MIIKKITNLEFGSLNYFLTRAFLISVIFNTIIISSKQNSWIIPIINLILGIIYIIIISKIMNYEPDISIFQKIKKLYNKNISITIILICIIYISFIGILNYLNLGNFVQSQFLSRTPITIISIVFALASFYVLNKGLTVLAKTSVILFYINIILFIISFIGLIPSINISNLKPFFDTPLKNNIDSLISFYAFNVGTIFMLTIIPKNKIKNEKSKKTLLLSFILSSITLFGVIFCTLSVLGYELSLLYEYPEFHVLKNISFIGSARIESILVMQLLFDAFICHCFIVYFISNGIADIFNIKKINYIYLIVLILFIFFTNTLSIYNVYIEDIIFKNLPIFSAAFISILPLIIFIKIKTKK